MNDDGMTKIHALLDELSEAVKEVFPDYTRADFMVGADGYRDIDITKWEPESEKPSENKRRMVVFEQHKFPDGEWSKDRSADQNAYYAEIGILLGGKNDDAESMAG